MARQAANPIRYRGKRRAEFLETILFMCPCCKKIGGLKEPGEYLSCTCGARMTYTEYGRLEGDGPFSTEEEWDRWQEAELRKMAAEAGETPIFQDASVTLTQLDNKNRDLSAYRAPGQLQRHHPICGRTRLAGGGYFGHEHLWPEHHRMYMRGRLL